MSIHSLPIERMCANQTTGCENFRETGTNTSPRLNAAKNAIRITLDAKRIM